MNSLELGETKEQFERSLKRVSEKYDDVCQDYDRELSKIQIELQKERDEHAQTQKRNEKLRKEMQELEEANHRLEAENRSLKVKFRESSVVLMETKDQQKRPLVNTHQKSISGKKPKLSTLLSARPRLRQSPEPEDSEHSTDSDDQRPVARRPQPKFSRYTSPESEGQVSLSGASSSGIYLTKGTQMNPVAAHTSRPQTSQSREIRALNRPLAHEKGDCPNCGKQMLLVSIARHMRCSCRAPAVSSIPPDSTQ